MKPRRCTVRLFDKKGFASELKLDSSKYDRIGFTQESLDQYMQNYLQSGRLYYDVIKDNYAKKIKAKNMEYTVIRNPHLDYLIKNINRYIKDGWRPQGGICIAATDHFPPEYYQALIRSV